MAQLVDWLAYSGARKSDGTAVAGGTAHFYQPGTSNTQISIYSDKDGLTTQSQPVTLDSGGRATVYVKRDAKIVVLDSSGSVVTSPDRSNTIQASCVEIENAFATGTDLVYGTQIAGGRTDLNTVLTSAATSFGSADFKYLESGATTARNIKDVAGETIRAQDFGAAGNGTIDDTSALQSAITRAIASNKPLYLEPGTYLISSTLTATGASAAGLTIYGSNRADSVIKNASTSNDALSIDLSSAIESNITLEDFGITASTTSSGAAIKFTNGNGPLLKRLNVALHRTGYDVSAVSHAQLEGCLVTSTDSNASGKGFRLGAHSTATKCRVTAAANGKGFSIEGQYGQVIDSAVIAASSGTGIDIAANDATVRNCFAGGATTGLNLGAYARAFLVGNKFGTNTTDIVINASATAYHETDNNWATLTDGAALGHTWLSKRSPFQTQITNDTSGANASLTPNIATANYYYYYVNHAAAGITLTINASPTTGLAHGQQLIFLIAKLSTNALTVSWNAQYTGGPGGTVNAATLSVYQFHWDALQSKWRLLAAEGSNAL